MLVCVYVYVCMYVYVLLVEANGGGLVCKFADFGLSNDVVLGVYMYVCMHV